MRLKSTDKLIALLFWASWYPECEEIRVLFEEMARGHSHIRFAWVDVDKTKEVVKEFKVNSVPNIVLLHVIKQFVNGCSQIKMRGNWSKCRRKNK